MNDSFLRMIAGYQPQPWTSRNYGWKLADNLLIENDNMFDWSDLQQKSYGDEEVLDFILRFLAMADLERVRVCSSGLTKTFFECHNQVDLITIYYHFPNIVYG